MSIHPENFFTNDSGDVARKRTLEVTLYTNFCLRPFREATVGGKESSWSHYFAPVTHPVRDSGNSTPNDESKKILLLLGLTLSILRFQSQFMTYCTYYISPIRTESFRILNNNQ